DDNRVDRRNHGRAIVNEQIAAAILRIKIDGRLPANGPQCVRGGRREGCVLRIAPVAVPSGWIGPELARPEAAEQHGETDPAGVVVNWTASKPTWRAAATWDGISSQKKISFGATPASSAAAS